MSGCSWCTQNDFNVHKSVKYWFEFCTSDMLCLLPHRYQLACGYHVVGSKKYYIVAGGYTQSGFGGRVTNKIRICQPNFKRFNLVP